MPGSPTKPLPKNTSPSPGRSKPSTTNHVGYPPMTKAPRCASFAARCTDACSATATAPDLSRWTATSSPSARAAPSSSPPSSSDQPCKPNATTPTARDRSPERRSSTVSSTASTPKPHRRGLDKITRITTTTDAATPTWGTSAQPSTNTTTPTNPTTLPRSRKPCPVYRTGATPDRLPVVLAGPQPRRGHPPTLAPAGDRGEEVAVRHVQVR